MKNKKDLDNILIETNEILLGRGDPDVILIGEVHTDLAHAYIISKIIEKERPEYVLYEGFTKENIPIFLNKKDAIGLSLQELFEKVGISLEYVGFTEETLNKEKLEERLLKIIRNLREKLIKIANEETNTNKTKINETEKYIIKIKVCPILTDLYNTYVDLAVIPNDYKEIISRPLAAWHPEILKYFLEILRNNREKFLNKKSYEDLNLELKKEFKDLYKESILTKMEKIEKILRFAKIYSELFRKAFLDLRPRYYVILSAIYKVGAKIGECDLDPTEFKELFEKARKYMTGEINHKEFFKEFNKLREKAMADIIEEYVKKRKRKSPIIAIVGKIHTYSVALSLKDRGIRCKIIDILDVMKEKNPAYKVCASFLYELSFKTSRIEEICELFKEHLSTDVPCP